MKKKNGLLQTFFYDFLKIQVTNWLREILVTFENQSSIIYWFLLRYTVIIYKFTQGNLGAKKSPEADFSRQLKKKIGNCDIGDQQRDLWFYIDFYIVEKFFELTNCENKSVRELPLFNLQIFLFRAWFQKDIKQYRFVKWR